MSKKTKHEEDYLHISKKSLKVAGLIVLDALLWFLVFAWLSLGAGEIETYPVLIAITSALGFFALLVGAFFLLVYLLIGGDK